MYQTTKGSLLDMSDILPCILPYKCIGFGKYKQGNINRENKSVSIHVKQDNENQDSLQSLKCLCKSSKKEHLYNIIPY